MLRYLLALKLHTNSFLYNKIIIAYAKSLACLVALVNLSPNLGALINSFTSNVTVLAFHVTWSRALERCGAAELGIYVRTEPCK